MSLRVLSAAALLAVATALAVTAPGAAAKSCSSKNAVITQQQQIIYFVKGEYRACYKKTGKTTRLITKGKDYSAQGVVAHGTHATVLEGVFDPFSGSPTVESSVTLWNVKTGKKFEAHVFNLAPDVQIGMV